MRSFGVEPDQILHELHVELLRLQEFVGMKVHELLLDRPIESFAVCIHLRCLRVRVVVREMQFTQALSEVFLEFTTIVGQYMFERHRKHHLAELKEFLCCLGGMGGRAPGEGETTVEIFEGNDVPSAAMDEPLNGVQCHAMSRMGSLKILGLPQDRTTVCLLHPSEVANLLWENSKSSQIMNESPDRGCRGDG